MWCPNKAGAVSCFYYVTSGNEKSDNTREFDYPWNIAGQGMRYLWNKFGELTHEIRVSSRAQLPFFFYIRSAGTFTLKIRLPENHGGESSHQGDNAILIIAWFVYSRMRFIP
jgi:hypothetical protein